MQHFLLLKPLFIFRGNILAPFHPIIFFLLLISEVPSQPQRCVSCSSSGGPWPFRPQLQPISCPEETWQQPHGQQSAGEGKVTSYLLLGPEREDKSSFQKNLKVGQSFKDWESPLNSGTSGDISRSFIKAPCGLFRNRAGFKKKERKKENTEPYVLVLIYLHLLS